MECWGIIIYTKGKREGGRESGSTEAGKTASWIQRTSGTTAFRWGTLGGARGEQGWGQICPIPRRARPALCPNHPAKPREEEMDARGGEGGGLQSPMAGHRPGGLLCTPGDSWCVPCPPCPHLLGLLLALAHHFVGFCKANACLALGEWGTPALCWASLSVL